MCRAPALGVLFLPHSPAALVLLRVSEAQQPGPKRAMGRGAGSQIAGSAAGFPRDGLGTEAVFLRFEEPQEDTFTGWCHLKKLAVGSSRIYMFVCLQ